MPATRIPAISPAPVDETLDIATAVAEDAKGAVRFPARRHDCDGTGIQENLADKAKKLGIPV